MTECKECNGDGWVDYEYEVGGFHPDRWMEIRVRRVVCEECGGFGEVEAEDD